ncbi:glycosyltransferase family 2 protein [Bacillus sonorensis]|uniref:Glycosyl transferase CsbB n=2 Tax=Bacillus sonorensis TaxID=119858 RepID=M5P0B4_9BACI|nr:MULTISPECIES: glycosyltransferase family 2 protein [Bacillus]TWK77066.1 putative glycosyltransferase CsbB [Bacillus paralicheniformis]ASB87631.1 Undecaprenyl-phosphate 4-deoxy-4-formamido-L-arabinose transferase [Bacillus sonorensis]EME72858.1 glycosyl transferase CsbB [Bacillus sonorensis L12]MBG9916399.1 glycosyltransferase [Bacillus sonorensis]MCF7617081.1 glycosyltransferase family 2 protein [Bacillus sonorensis]
MKKGFVSIIIPSYNEASNIKLIYESLRNEFQSIEYDYEIYYINDGSTDQTLEEIKNLAEKNERVKYISFSRNFGKEAAILAGFQHARGDAVVVMDADLQHPTYLLHDFIKGFEEGYDQVIAQRNRKGDNPIRSYLSSLYYRFINKAVEVDLRDGVGDFRLLSRKAVNALLKLSEGNRFSKGLFCWIGFDQKIIYYENVERKNGKSKWSFRHLLNYGIDGIVSFNNRPLRICFYTGIFILFLSLIYIIATFIRILKYGVIVPGYFTIISAVLFLGGVQLLSLGIIGEYIGRIYYETKKRPHYLIQEANIGHGEAHEKNES